MKQVRLNGRSSTAREWNRIARLRHHQILSGDDISYSRILVPAVTTLLGDADTRRVVDLGCGSGVLTKLLASTCKQVLAIDISTTSLKIAKEHCRNTPNVTFERISIEDLPKTHGGLFTAAVANMSLVTCSNLRRCVQAVSRSLTRRGTFVLTITHPCFWPRYWGYEGRRWFRYDRELAIRAPFKTSLCESGRCTTHVHRSLGTYFAAFKAAGFVVEDFTEPTPDDSAARLYPKTWSFPRFIGIRLRRNH